MSDKKPTKSEQLAQGEQSFNPGVFKAFFDRVTASAADGNARPKLRRREASVIIDHTQCEPDTFNEPFRLTLESLSSDDELRALEGASNQSSIAFALAKRSIRALNGHRLASHEVSLLWEALSMGGRSVVSAVFMENCSGMDEVKLGESLRTVEVG